MKTNLEGEVKSLGMEKARFSVVLSELQNYTDKGKDGVDFYFQANSGEELKPLAMIASGGELSRIMLALKTIMHMDKNGPVLVFDEVDTGVSGRIADFMGQKLKSLSKEQQVIAITHLPQIAAKGDVHFTIFKDFDGHRTKTKLKHLTQEERIIEIAKIIGGENLSEISMKHAEDLLLGAKSYE